MIEATRPTVTPALRTGARTFSPPMLSKYAVRRVGVAAAEIAQVGGLEGEEQQPEHAEKHEQARPASLRLFFPSLHPRSSHDANGLDQPPGVENIMAVSTKSMISVASEATTTPRVVASDTPFGVGSAS